MKLEAIKSNIEYLIEQYEQSIMLLEDDIKDGSIGKVYLIGQLKAHKEIIEHLQDLLDENNYDE